MVLQNKLKIYTYKSKYNLKRKNQVVLLILTDSKKKKKWHYLAVKKKKPALCRGITSNHKGDFHS